MLESKVIATNGEYDLVLIGNEVYRTRVNAVVDIYGLPQDRRWECSFTHWKIYKDTNAFDWVDQVRED